MRKTIRAVVVGTVCLLIGGLGYLTWKNYQARTARNSQQFILPNFSLENLDGTPYTQSDLPVQTPIMFLYFNPDCDHCVREVEGIKANAEALQSQFIVMVTFADLERTTKFVEAQGLNAYENIHLTLDPLDNFSRAFGAKEVPSTYLYGANRTLIKYWSGEVNIETVLEMLEEGSP